MATPTVTKGAQDAWIFQDSYVERLLDNAAFTSAHPDDTLVLAGPARFGGPNFIANLLAIGMIQNFTVSQAKFVTPMMSIGSGRQFFTAGKAQTNWNVGRLFVNGRNLLRVLHTQAKQAGIDVSKFDDPAALSKDNQYFVNLDSELFLIPFGLAILFRDKVHQKIGAFYIELCMINQWQIGFSSGQTFIAENVSGVADRILPLNVSTVPTNTPPTGTPDTLSPDVLNVEGAAESFGGESIADK